MESVRDLLSENIETLEDVAKIKERVKLIEKKIKQNNKPKTITISGKTHKLIKDHCAHYDLNLGSFVEDIILDKLKGDDPIIIDDRDGEEILEETTENIINDYKKEILRNKDLIKSDRLIIREGFTFKGYSKADSLPIYEFNSGLYESFDDMKMSEYFIDRSIKIVTEREISKGILYNNDIEF
jgi:hypothetical protein